MAPNGCAPRTAHGASAPACRAGGVRCALRTRMRKTRAPMRARLETHTFFRNPAIRKIPSAVRDGN
eukprot:5344769-Alexandrium_andersonii.AAC.1